MESIIPKPVFSVVRGRYCKDEVDEYVRTVGETIERLQARIVELEQIPTEERFAAAELEADQLLQRARQEADGMIAQAVSREAEEIVATLNARAELEKALAEVRGEASHILETARSEADTILGEVRMRAESMYSGVVEALDRGEMRIGVDPTGTDLEASPEPRFTPLPLLGEGEPSETTPAAETVPSPDADADLGAAADLAAAVDAVTDLLNRVDQTEAALPTVATLSPTASTSPVKPSPLSPEALWDSSEDPDLAEHPFFSEEIADDPSRKWILAS